MSLMFAPINNALSGCDHGRALAIDNMIDAAVGPAVQPHRHHAGRLGGMGAAHPAEEVPKKDGIRGMGDAVAWLADAHQRLRVRGAGCNE